MARPKEVPGRVLLQARLPAQSIAQLHRVKGETQANSVAEVLGRAIRLYAACVDEMGKGGTIWIEGQDGTKIKAFLT